MEKYSPLVLLWKQSHTVASASIAPLWWRMSRAAFRSDTAVAGKSDVSGCECVCGGGSEKEAAHSAE